MHQQLFKSISFLVLLLSLALLTGLASCNGPSKVKVSAASVVSYEPEMVFVEGGTFQMGSSNGEEDESPVHQVTLSSFNIGKYEVTQAQWREVMGSNPSYFKDCDQCPVEPVSWNDVQDFIKKLNTITGKQ
ncbi:MAG: formylglycine-generating enzyme family protein, partial [Flavobacteriales bacterium]